MPRIAIVEDDERLADDLELELSSAGYEVVVAYDGLAGLAAIENQPPDLIICDVMMPEMDGHELVRRLRITRPALMARVPFVFLTALGMRGDINRGRIAGAAEYLVKPVDFDVLQTVIGRLLNEEKAP